MKMSDIIADFIGEMLSEGGGVAEVQRKSLADRFSCVPSQINYVIETRFTPEHGYLVESQRGGGGYIRIVRVRMDDDRDLLSELMDTIGQEISQDGAQALISRLNDLKLINARESAIMNAAVQDAALNLPVRAKDVLRAGVLRNMIEQVFMMNE